MPTIVMLVSQLADAGISVPGNILPVPAMDNSFCTLSTSSIIKNKIHTYMTIHLLNHTLYTMFFLYEMRVLRDKQKLPATFSTTDIFFY